MDTDYLTKAIQKLRPTAEFSYSDNDYSTIKWNVLEGNAPTIEQIEAAIKVIKADEKAAITKATADKLALLEKLGITADEAKLLLQ